MYTKREANLKPLILWPLYRPRIRVWQVAASSWPLRLDGWTVKIADICPGGPVLGTVCLVSGGSVLFHLIVPEGRYFVPMCYLGLTQGMVLDRHAWHMGRRLGPGLQMDCPGPKAGPRPWMG